MRNDGYIDLGNNSNGQKGLKSEYILKLSYCQEVLQTDYETEGEKISCNDSDTFSHIIPFTNHKKLIRGGGLKNKLMRAVQ